MSAETVKDLPFQFELNVAKFDAFKKLKELLLSSSIPAPLRHGQRYTLDSDSDDYHVGIPESGR